LRVAKDALLATRAAQVARSSSMLPVLKKKKKKEKKKKIVSCGPLLGLFLVDSAFGLAS